MSKDLSFKRRMIMVGNLVKETAKYTRSGFKTRTKEEQEKVIAICMQCEFYNQNRFTPRCKKCGCYMDIKKRWITSHCKISKW